MPKKTGAKKTAFGADLIEGMKLVLAHDRGKVELEQVWPKPIDVKAIRKRVKMSQAEFSRTYGLSKLALQEWEQGEGDTQMKDEKLELVRGSGNVFHDLCRENADLEQLKALLATEIIKTLDREELTVRAAHSRTGFAAADFSRIRSADLARFTADRLMSILNRLGSRVEVRIRVRPLEPIRGEQRA